MRIIIAAVGRMKKGPEQELVQRYADRIVKTGRPVGITGLDFIEIAESRASDGEARKREEAAAILAKLPDKTPFFVFDERGKSPSSRVFASQIEAQTGDQSGALALLIGGPDGLDGSLRQSAKQIVSFGGLTIPHQLVRILVLEQVYRATTILTNHPYHRD